MAHGPGSPKKWVWKKAWCQRDPGRWVCSWGGQWSPTAPLAPGLSWFRAEEEGGTGCPHFSPAAPLFGSRCPFTWHLAESDNNNKTNFQQLQLHEKRAQCFLTQKHRELRCHPAISDTWKTLCSVPENVMCCFFFFMFYFNGSTLKELVVRCIVHHGNEVWGCVGPGILYFFSLIPAISKGGKEAVGAQGQPEGLCLLFPSHLCGWRDEERLLHTPVFHGVIKSNALCWHNRYS